MTEEKGRLESERFELQTKSQLLVRDQLALAQTSFAERLQFEEQLCSVYESELEKLKREYSELLLASQCRESELLLRLQTKDEEIAANKEELENLKNLNEKVQIESDEVLKKMQIFEPMAMVLQDLNKTPAVLEENNLFQLKSELEALKITWKATGNDKWEEQTSKIEDLKQTLSSLYEEQAKAATVYNELELQTEFLQQSLSKLQKSSETTSIERQKLKICEDELQTLNTSTKETKEKLETLSEKLKIYKLEKDTLQNKLEKVYEMLVKESLVTSEHQEMLESESEVLKKLTDQFEAEKSENERISEEVIQEKMTASRLKDQLAKSKDIDTHLSQTLKQIGQEGAIKKSEEGYLFRDSPISLYLHNECMVVVRIGAGLMPLGDYLKNASLPEKVLHPRTVLGEAKQENFCKREIKSPMKNVPAVAIKASKTPLRDRGASVGEKKKLLSK